MPLQRRSRNSRSIRIAQYEIIARIATGGMGAVYKAVDVDRGRAVALKVLAPDHAQKPVLLKRFQVEAMLGKRLPPHAHVASLFESGIVRDFHFLALEFVEGIDLREWLDQRGPLSVHESRPLILQAARALEHLDRFGVTHRDIKPSNFLLTHVDARPTIKLIDLGLARYGVDDDDDRNRPFGSTLGTIDYLAPEQARNCAAADGRSDIYSLGCTWYHLLAGEPPFPSGTLTEKVRQHAESVPPDLRRRRRGVNARALRVLSRMMAKNPADRYPNATVLIHELKMLGRALGKAPSRPNPALPV